MAETNDIGLTLFVANKKIKFVYESSQEVKGIITKKWEEKFGGKLEYVSDINEVLNKVIGHIQAKRKALKIDVKKERVLFDMEARRGMENV